MNGAQPLQAPVSLLPLPRPLMTGEVLDAAFRLFRAGLLRCLPYSGLAALVLELPTLYATFLTSKSVIMQMRIAEYLSVFLLMTFLIGVITLRLQAVARGLRPSFRSEAGHALRRWLPALIATAGALGFPILVFVFASAISNLFLGEALLVLAAPILWPTALLVGALPAFWCEGRGPFAAIVRSVGLARRRSWRMVGAVLATACMVAVFYLLTVMIIGMGSNMLGRADLYLISVVESLMWLVVGMFGMPFVLAVLIVAYEDLTLREAERRGAGT